MTGNFALPELGTERRVEETPYDPAGGRPGNRMQGSANVTFVLISDVLGGHLKTDHRGSLQNRPMGTTLDKNCFTAPAVVAASPVLI